METCVTFLFFVFLHYQNFHPLSPPPKVTEHSEVFGLSDKQSLFFYRSHIQQGIRVKIQNFGKNWFFWFSLLGGEN